MFFLLQSTETQTGKHDSILRRRNTLRTCGRVRGAWASCPPLMGWPLTALHAITGLRASAPLLPLSSNPATPKPPQPPPDLPFFAPSLPLLSPSRPHPLRRPPSPPSVPRLSPLNPAPLALPLSFPARGRLLPTPSLSVTASPHFFPQ